MDYETFFKVIIYGSIVYYGYLRSKNRTDTNKSECDERI